MILQKLSEAIEEITNDFKLKMEDSIQSFSESCKDSSMQFRNIFENLDSGINKLKDCNENLVISTNNIVDQILNINIPEDIINQKFESIFNTLKNKLSGISTSVTNINKKI